MSKIINTNRLKSRALHAVAELRMAGFNSYVNVLEVRYPEYQTEEMRAILYRVTSGRYADVLITERLESLALELVPGFKELEFDALVKKSA